MTINTLRNLKNVAPEAALKRLQEIAAARQEEELEDYREAMEREKEERLKRVEEERARQVLPTVRVLAPPQRRNFLR